MSNDATAPLERPRWSAAVVVALCQSTQALLLGGVALFLPLIRADLGLSFTQAAAFAASSTFIYALMQIPSGFLADRLDPRHLFAIGLVGTNAMAIVFALLHDYGLLLVNQALSGFFRALVFAPGLLIVAALFPPRRRATAMGLFIAGGFSSNIFLSLLGPVLVDPLGWRWLFAIFGLLGFASLVAYWHMPQPARPRDGVEQPSVRDALRLFRSRVMWLFGAIQYVRLAIVFGLATWLPSLVVEDKGYSLQTAGLVLAVSALVTVPSNLIGGVLSDRLRRPLLVIGGSLAMLALTTALLVHVDGIVALLAVVAVNSVFVQFYFAPLFAMPIQMLGTRTAGLTSGFSNFFANVGGFTFIYAVGALKDVTGSFDVGLYALAGAAIAGLLCTLALARMHIGSPAV